MIRYRWIQRTDWMVFCDKRTCWIIMKTTGTVMHVGKIITNKILMNWMYHGENSTSQDKPGTSIIVVDVKRYCKIKIMNGKEYISRWMLIIGKIGWMEMAFLLTINLYLKEKKNKSQESIFFETKTSRISRWMTRRCNFLLFWLKMDGYITI